MRVKKMISWRGLALICILFAASQSFGQHVTTTNVAGNGSSMFTDGTDALMNGIGVPNAIAADNDGNIYFGVAYDFTGDTEGLYKIDVESGTISLVLDNTVAITGLAIGDDDKIYICFGVSSGQPYDPEYIYFIDPANPGVLDTIAGNGISGIPTEGWTARETPIGNAGGLKIKDNFLYYSAILSGTNPDDITSPFYYNFIQKIDLEEGKTYRVIGDAEIAPGDEVEDGTLGTSALLNLDIGIGWDIEGSIYFSTLDYKIKMLNIDDNRVYNVAGNGDETYDATQTMAATAALGIRGSGFIITESNELIICDIGNNLIRKVTLLTGSSTDGETIETVVGTGFSPGDGVGENDLINYEFQDPLLSNIKPRDLVMTVNGVYFSDEDDSRIRRVYTCKNPEYTDPVISKEIICAGDSVQLSYTAQANDGTIWRWYEDECGENQIDGEITSVLSVIVDEDKTYYARGEGGCSNNTSCLEFVLEVACADFFNAFTPNGDGKNDFFEIPILDNYATNTVIIYNRWGQLLEQIENYDNLTTVWNGTNGGDDPVDSGTYYFTAEANGEVISSGWVQVIK